MVLKYAILRNIDSLRFSHLIFLVSSDDGYAAITPNVGVRRSSLLLRILEVPSSNFGPHCGRPDRSFRYFSSVLATRCRYKVQVNVLPVHTTVAWGGAEL
jgi:hypothetical protein